MEKLISKDIKGRTLYKNTFAPNVKNEWISLRILLGGLPRGAFHLDDIPAGLLAEYMEWHKKRQEELHAEKQVTV